MDNLALIIPILALLIPVTAIALNSPIAKAYSERLRHRDLGPTGNPPEVARLERQVAQLEGDLDSANKRIARIEEEQQFVLRLLEDKTGESPN